MKDTKEMIDALYRGDNSFVWTTFQTRQNLAAASAKYDAARSDLVRMRYCPDGEYDTYDIVRACKRVEKAEGKLYEATREYIGDVKNFFANCGSCVGSFEQFLYGEHISEAA